MAIKVYDSGAVTIAGTTFEVSNFTVSIQQGTTPDWEYFTADNIVNYPTTYSWTGSFSATLDGTYGARVATWLSSEVELIFTALAGAPVYTGNCTVSADIDVSRSNYGMVNFTCKGTGPLTIDETV